MTIERKPHYLAAQSYLALNRAVDPISPGLTRAWRMFVEMMKEETRNGSI